MFRFFILGAALLFVNPSFIGWSAVGTGDDISSVPPVADSPATGRTGSPNIIKRGNIQDLEAFIGFMHFTGVGSEAVEKSGATSTVLQWVENATNEIAAGIQNQSADGGGSVGPARTARSGARSLAGVSASADEAADSAKNSNSNSDSATSIVKDNPLSPGASIVQNLTGIPAASAALEGLNPSGTGSMNSDLARIMANVQQITAFDPPPIGAAKEAVFATAANDSILESSDTPGGATTTTGGGMPAFSTGGGSGGGDSPPARQSEGAVASASNQQVANTIFVSNFPNDKAPPAKPVAVAAAEPTDDKKTNLAVKDGGKPDGKPPGQPPATPPVVRPPVVDPPRPPGGGKDDFKVCPLACALRKELIAAGYDEGGGPTYVYTHAKIAAKEAVLGKIEPLIKKVMDGGETCPSVNGIQWGADNNLIRLQIGWGEKAGDCRESFNKKGADASAGVADPKPGASAPPVKQHSDN